MRIDKLLSWQKKAVAQGGDREEFAIFSEPGTGKTIVAIKIIGLGDYCTIIFAPPVTLFNWEREIRDNLGIPVSVVHGTPGRRLRIVEEGLSHGRITVIGYPALRNKKILRVLEEQLPDRTFLICDEAHALKAPRTLQHKSLSRIARGTIKRLFLTGTPYLTSLENIFYLYRVLDNGKTFGGNVYGFRNRYLFDLNARRQGTPGYFPNFAPKEGSAEEIGRVLARSSIRITLAECVDLPPLIEEKIQLVLEGKQRKLYDQMLRDFLIEFKNEVIATPNIIAQMAKLQQITSGFIYKDGKALDITPNAKLLALIEYVQRIEKTGKSCIIWHTFRHERKFILNALIDLRIPYLSIYGGQDMQERQQNIDFFQAGEVSFIVSQRGAGGIGINLTRAAYSLVYSRPFGLGTDLQANARNYRKGSEQHDKVVRYGLMCLDTIDELIEKSIGNHLTGGQNIYNMIKGVKL